VILPAGRQGFFGRGLVLASSALRLSHSLPKKQIPTMQPMTPKEKRTHVRSVPGELFAPSE